MAESKTYGYVRVSSKDQNEARQMIALQQFGIPGRQIYMDKQSGKNFERPNCKRLLKKLKEGEIFLSKWIQSHKSETAQKPLEIRRFTAFAPSSAAVGKGRFSVLWR